jgi:digalactosyldiacylglycerol synthase
VASRYRAPGDSWTKKFKHVVGILHTNYFQYALDQPAAIVRAPAMRLLCSWMCRAHCHRIIKLSGTLEPVAPEKELVENVHGVRANFIDTGVELRSRLGKFDEAYDPVFGATADPKIYFIGKMLWSKGLGSLMELLKFAEETTDLKVKVDMYGGGPDLKAADSKATKLGVDMVFHGPLDHSEVATSHKIFVNPSTSEVLCTTSAEALAMGKFVILPSHVSNDFFAQFPNCLAYTTKEEFVANLYYAITHEPEPLSQEYAHALSWEAATERLAAAASIPVEEADRIKQTLASDNAVVEVRIAESSSFLVATNAYSFSFFACPSDLPSSTDRRPRRPTTGRGDTLQV